MNKLDTYIGFEGFKQLTVADLRHGDQILAMLAVKLQTMDPEQFQTRLLEERVRFLMVLLRETFANRYQGLSLSAFANILVALDYFLKVRDEKPDTRPDGYIDDFHQVEKVFGHYHQEFKMFKDWQARQPAG